jgi:hypothetical protein
VNQPKLLPNVKTIPLSIKIIGGFFVLIGVLTLSVSIWEVLTVGHPHQGVGVPARPEYQFAAAYLVRVTALIAGVALLAGRAWGRWLLVVWLAYHLVLSLFHSAAAVVVHSVLLGVGAYFLFRPEASLFLVGKSRIRAVRE